MRQAGQKNDKDPTVYIRITTPDGDANAHITLKDCKVKEVRNLIQAAVKKEELKDAIAS